MDQSSETPRCGCHAAANCILNGDYEFYRYGGPRPAVQCSIQFKEVPFQRVINAIVPAMCIQFPPGVEVVGPVNVCYHFGSDFYLSLSDVQRINLSNRVPNDRKQTCQLQIRVGEQQPGTIELLEVIPSPISMWINSKQLPTDNMKSPLNVNAIDYLHLNTVNPNRFTIYWPECKKPFIIVIYLVEVISVEELVQDIKLDNSRYFSAISTKQRAKSVLKRSVIDLEFAVYTLSLLCPITKSKMILPARSVNCDHIHCFDLQAFISSNMKNSTWLCPICYEPCQLDDLKIDSFVLFILNSFNVPKNCEKIHIFVTGKWRPCLPCFKRLEILSRLPKKTIIEIDLANSDDENLGDVKPILPIENAGNSNDIKPKSVMKITKYTKENDAEENPPPLKIIKKENTHD